MVPLPKFVAISNTGARKKFVRPNGGVVKYEDVDFLTRNVKHEVVASTTHPGRVHLKCVDTGKYWSWGLDPTTKNYVAAQSNKREPDMSSNACTLVNYTSHSWDGKSFFKLRLRWKSAWHLLYINDAGFLESGERKGGSRYTAFVIEDWDHLVRENRKKIAAAAASTSAGPKNIAVSLGKLNITNK